MPIVSSSLSSSPYTQDDIEVSPESVRSATVEQAKSDLVGPSILRWAELNAVGTQGGRAGGAHLKRFNAEEASQYMTDAGLEGQFSFDRDYNQLELKLLAARKQSELKRQAILARADQSASATAGRFGLQLATSFLDPLTVASAFIPVVGEAKYAQLIGRAGGAMGRAGVRAGVGATEGTVGAALVEPIIAGAKWQEQADYTLADSLLNIGIGGVLGGGLHTVGGAVGDALRQAPSIELPPDLANIPAGDGLSAGDRLIEANFGQQLQSDPQGAVAAYAKLPDTSGGKVLNTDIARELSPDYLNDRTKSAAVHEPASALVKTMYAQKLSEAPKLGEEPLVVFSAGGTGAGKTTGLELTGVGSRAQIVYDSNMNSLPSSVRRIEQALAAGKQVQILYTYRDPVEALANGALPRATRQEKEFGSGRTVPLAEHAKTHVGAADVVRQLAEKYANDPRVNITVVDNSLGKGKATVSDLSVVPHAKTAHNDLVGKLHETLDQQRQAGKISESIYQGFKGDQPAASQALQPEGLRSADGRGSSQEAQQFAVNGAAAQDVVATSTPDIREAALKSAVSQAVTGQPIEARPIYDRSTLKDAAARLNDPDQRPLSNPASVERADATIKAGETADDATIEKQVQELDEQLKAMEPDAVQTENQEFAEIVATLRDELKQTDSLTRESSGYARQLVACAMRSA